MDSIIRQRRALEVASVLDPTSTAAYRLQKFNYKSVSDDLATEDSIWHETDAMTVDSDLWSGTVMFKGSKVNPSYSLKNNVTGSTVAGDFDVAQTIGGGTSNPTAPTRPVLPAVLYGGLELSNSDAGDGPITADGLPSDNSKNLGDLGPVPVAQYLRDA